MHRTAWLRRSSRIGMDYVMYLSFTRVLSSAEKLHGDLFPVFARADQAFINGKDLKAALSQMADD